MWVYHKKLQYPVNITSRNVRLAKSVITQLGGPDGELAASLRYLNQRYTMPDSRGKALLTDIGTEELAHVEIVSTIVYQLMEGATIEELKAAGLDAYYADHGKGIYPINGEGVPFTVKYFASKGDPIADLYEDLAAEDKARITYEYLIELAANHPDVIAPLKFLHDREIVHFNRFNDLLKSYQQMGLDKVPR